MANPACLSKSCPFTSVLIDGHSSTYLVADCFMFLLGGRNSRPTRIDKNPSIVNRRKGEPDDFSHFEPK
jgi:hypothetical protein